MDTDVLVLGCGIAGATAALKLAADRERQVTVLTRATEEMESSSWEAQGGIATIGRDDTPELLSRDILAAGAGLSLPRAVAVLAHDGPRLIEELLVGEAGVAFDRDTRGGPHYGLEAAHSRHRIVHVGDATGRAIMRGLLARLRERPNVTLLRRHTAVDLITLPHHAVDPLAVYDPPSCRGAYVLEQDSHVVFPILARRTVLATGGLGQIYLHTSNPEGARGDGLALAYRAGARVINAEYVQFHPTSLVVRGSTRLLISEALRGEGAVLLTPRGEPFLERYAPHDRELAPRHVVARAIYQEMLAHGYPNVLLDIASRRSPQEVRERFPTIHARCLGFEVDITRQPIPVVPAAHYFCGGVLVDLDGRTSLPGLYAVGEVSCTGVHGANRLASTSLLEGLVWGARAAQSIRAETDPARPLRPGDIPPWDETMQRYDADPALIQGDLQTIRNLMWHYVGLVRNNARLDRAIRELRSLWLSTEEFYRHARLTDALLGLRNSVQAALVIAYAARRNPRSRGCHHRDDPREGPELASPQGTTRAW
jgi:L-aspartate oxidase